MLLDNKATGILRLILTITSPFVQPYGPANRSALCNIYFNIKLLSPLYRKIANTSILAWAIEHQLSPWQYCGISEFSDRLRNVNARLYPVYLLFFYAHKIADANVKSERKLRIRETENKNWSNWWRIRKVMAHECKVNSGKRLSKEICENWGKVSRNVASYSRRQVNRARGVFSVHVLKLYLFMPSPPWMEPLAVRTSVW